ncbi:MAG: hypothetical protein DIZ80_09375 [endosymbiont of Galathealinum brachiosum]|uniref:histidine kinase n=1 Tax=endosymbiont of Galathealinum brachiosum TaxID=2200906 RepID=A0A370DC58_9GAMM|nr:MAG: hypothetical protein DIZ80_09375 [endosymbiont of Galathealinum brachiosum]
MKDISKIARSKNLSSAYKYIWSLIIGFSALLALVIMVNWISLTSIQQLQVTLEDITDNHLERIISVSDMEENARLRIITMYRMIHIDDPFDLDDSNQLLSEYAVEFYNAREKILNTQLDNNEKELIEVQGNKAGVAVPIQRKFSDTIMQGQYALAAEILKSEASPAHKELLNAMEDLYQYQINNARAAATKGKNDSNTTLNELVWLSIITFVVALVIGSIVIIRAFKLTIEREKHLSELENMNREANLANESKSTFLANMSHEIRTPLTAIIGFSDEMLEQGQLNSHDLNSANTISRSGKHLLHVINEILDFSKIEAGKLEIEKMDTPLFELLNDLYTLIDLQAQEKGLLFKINYAFPLPEFIYTDPTRLKQILLNLCNNAVKFTEKGSVIIDVSINNDQLIFKIIDTGIGISNSRINDVFSSFAQEDSSTTRRFGGTGLGLCISKLLSEKLGGNLSVESKKDKGSEFKLIVSIGDKEKRFFVNSLPINEEQITNRKFIEKHSNQIKGEILLAEDNKDNQALIQLLINKTDCVIDIANNGEIAVNKVNSSHYDLILMDMQMPVMDGIEAVKLIRKSGFEKPIIALTANARKSDIQSCYSAGFTDFISKPIDRGIFYASLEKHLNKKIEINHDLSLKQDKSLSDLRFKFILTLPDTLIKIINSIETNDTKELDSLLHNLKGMGGSFGCPEITECANELETSLQHSGIEIMPEKINELKNLIKDISA